MPTLVHGVDISTLEGWMVKINSNPSMFGKSLSRRWFRVSFVPAGNDQKLIISYSTNKTSKEPRGWLYIEDVSGVYCRRDMIEVVSPARTLRFKGETTVEHRLWSDSLHKLCNPPKTEPQEEKRLAAESAALHERQRERLRSQDRDRIADPKKTREYVDSSREPGDEAKPTVSTRKSVTETSSAPRESANAPPPRRRASSPDQRDSRRRNRRNNSSDDDDDNSESDHQASSEEDGEASRAPPRRREAQDSPRERRAADQVPSASRNTKAKQNESPRAESPREVRREDSQRRSPREEEDEESEDDERRRPRQVSANSEDSDEEEEEEEQPRRASAAPMERRPSLLVASIKSLSPVVAMPAQPKPAGASTKVSESKASAVECREASPAKRDAKAANHSDDEEGDGEDPQKDSPREQAAPAPAATPVVSKAKTKSTEYFDEDESDDDREDADANNKRRPSIPVAQAPAHAIKAPVSEVRADNNFVEDDWDAEDPAPAPSRSKQHGSPEKRASVGFGGVAADANFATEDWD